MTSNMTEHGAATTELKYKPGFEVENDTDISPYDKYFWEYY